MKNKDWTIHLISDACADDVWSATDVAVFDRDDYLTTLAELRIANRYNFAGANQTERFFKHANKAEAHALEQALRGALVRNATLICTDMLGFNPKRVKGNDITLAPLEFAKVVIY